MDIIQIEATDSTPKMVLDTQNNTFLISGESYPENVTKCYGEIFETLKNYLDNLSGESFQATFELIYFNSSSVKIIMNLFDLFEDCASKDNDVKIIWCYHEDDETIEEFGEEFAEDLEHASFEMKVISE